MVYEAYGEHHFALAPVKLAGYAALGVVAGGAASAFKYVLAFAERRWPSPCMRQSYDGAAWAGN